MLRRLQRQVRLECRSARDGVAPTQFRLQRVPGGPGALRVNDASFSVGAALPIIGAVDNAWLDKPDTISIGPVHEIPIVHDDDPRFEEERIAWSHARAIAQAAVSPDQLLGGLHSEDWMVKHECVDRLIARGRHDERTLPALLDAAEADAAWQVRSQIVIRLHEFPGVQTVRVLHEALADERSEVRWSAGFSLFQLGVDPGPGWNRDG